MATKWGFPDLIEEEDENIEQEMLDKIKDQTKKEVLLGEQSEKRKHCSGWETNFPVNPLRVNSTKWLNTLKQFVGKSRILWKLAVKALRLLKIIFTYFIVCLEEKVFHVIIKA